MMKQIAIKDNIIIHLNKKEKTKKHIPLINKKLKVMIFDRIKVKNNLKMKERRQEVLNITNQFFKMGLMGKLSIIII